MKFFSFWRSLATYRVRIALNLKGIKPDEIIDINLDEGRATRRKIPRSQSDDGDSCAG